MGEMTGYIRNTCLSCGKEIYGEGYLKNCASCREKTRKSNKDKKATRRSTDK